MHLTPATAGAPGEKIEVTPEMIEAGAVLISEYFDQAIDWLTEERARNIYLAMAAKAP